MSDPDQHPCPTDEASGIRAKLRGMALSLMKDVKRMRQVGVFHVLILVIGLRGMGFIQQVALTNILHEDIVGQAIYILRMMMLLAVIADLGINASVLKYVAEPVSDQERMDLYKTGMVFSFAFSSVFAVLYALVILAIPMLGYDVGLQQEFLFMALYLPVISLSKVPPYFLQACKQIKKASNISLVANFIRIALVVIGAYFFGLWGYLVAMVLGPLTHVVLFVGATYRPLIQGMVRRSLLGKLLHFGFFSLLGNFSSLANASAGVFLLRWMGCSDQEVAIFGIATFVNLAVRLFPSSLIRTAFPYLSDHRNNPVALMNKVKELSKKEGLVVLGLCGILAATGMWFLPIVFKSFYIACYWPMVLLFVATLTWSIAAPFGQAMFVTDHVRVNFLVALGALAVNVGLCFLLIPAFKSVGAAGAISISTCIGSLGTILACRKFVRKVPSPVI